MPFNANARYETCLICGSSANVAPDIDGHIVRCARCGDFWIRDIVSARWQSKKDAKKVALASHLIRKMQVSRSLPLIEQDFLDGVESRSLPRPAESTDGLLLWCAGMVDGRPGASFQFSCDDLQIQSLIGVANSDDLEWIARTLEAIGWVGGRFRLTKTLQFEGKLSLAGWDRIEELKRAEVSSKYAFFARKFDNPELDRVFADCLFPAVKNTGYELRAVTQKAGPVDAIIEDEIRRCRFLIADLTDGNNGAYWEAGFAEGLGKPVIYICRDVDEKTGKPLVTHFDTDHRHTVRWNLNSLGETAKQLKAVIRNTLLGDANQSDE